VKWQGPSDNKQIRSIWFENWANPGSVGTELYDRIVVETTGSSQSFRIGVWVAHDDLVDERHREIMQPLRLRAFLEHDMNLAAHPTEGGAQGRRFRCYDRAGHYVPRLVANRDHRGCLMHVKPDIPA
jgi:hypothetical protein